MDLKFLRPTIGKIALTLVLLFIYILLWHSFICATVEPETCSAEKINGVFQCNFLNCYYPHEVALQWIINVPIPILVAYLAAALIVTRVKK